MNLTRIFGLALGCSIIFACGGGGSDVSTGGGGGGGGGSLAETTKIQLVENMGAQMNNWRSLPKNQRHTNLVTWAKTQSGVAAAGIASETNNVWVRFTDGDVTLYLDNKESTGVGKPAPVPTAMRGDMPTETKAYTIFSLESHKFEDLTDGLKTDLNNQGYNASRVVAPTVDQLLAMNGASVLFWQAHSGVGEEERNGKKTTLFAVVTGEPCSKDLSLKYKTYRDAGELFIAGLETKNPDGTIGKPVAVYAVTDRFIKNHMKLATNSFVALDSCTSAFGTLYQAFQAAGAGTYVGWSSLAGGKSGERMTLMFDRLLGTNIEPPVSSPIERPFDIDRVEEWMLNKGYNQDASPTSTAQLKWFYKAGDAKGLMLKPTIARVIYTANDSLHNKSSLTIEGTFGPDPGAANRQVMWGTKQLEVITWSELEGIRVKMPAKPYPQDDIQVIKRGRRSNKVPMTEWTIPFTYTFTGKGSLTYTITLNIKMRSDARSARWEPEANLLHHPVAMWQLDDSTGTISASGTYKPSSDTTVTWSGGSNLISQDSGFNNMNGIIFGGTLNTLTGKIDAFALNCLGTFTQTVRTASNVQTTQVAAGLDGYLMPFSLTMNPTSFGIAAGSASPTSPIGNQYGQSAALQWGAAAAVNPPNNNTPRRDN